jgi:hypothetical protein
MCSENEVFPFLHTMSSSAEGFPVHGQLSPCSEKSRETSEILISVVELHLFFRHLILFKMPHIS